MDSIWTGSGPRLSVLLTAGDRRERVANALASVLRQELVAQIEVVVLECGDPNGLPVPGQDYPCVRTVRFSQGVSAGHVRAEGVRLARAPILVFLEEHAAACPGWVEAILRTFEQGEWTAVGPEMINGSRSLGISDALSLCSYPLYESPAARRETTWLPFHNTAYRREAVLKYDRDLERLFAVEILLQWRLHADGHRFLLEPACKVMHYYETDIPTIWRHEVNAQRAFVVNRAGFYRWPVWKRVGRAAAAPLIPVVRPLKLFFLLVRQRPDQIGRFLRRLPVMIASSHMACAVGEIQGLLMGGRDGDVRYLYHSVNALRELPPNFPDFTLEQN